MGLLDPTIWNDWQAENATSDIIYTSYGVIDLVNNSTPSCNYISPEIERKFREFSGNRGIEIPVILDGEATVVTTPGFEFIPDNLSSSDTYSFTAYDFFTGFRHYPSIYEGNVSSESYDLNVKTTRVMQALANKMEQTFVSILDTRRTQVLDGTLQVNQSTGGGTYTFDTGTDTLKIDKAAQQETMFAPLSNLMEANDMSGNYATVVSPIGLAVQKQEAIKFGASNTQNIRALGMIPASDMHNSKNISAGADVFNGYWVRKGEIGVYTNHPYNFRMGTVNNSAKWSVSDVNLPFINMRGNIYHNEFSTNATALVGVGTDTNSIMTVGEEMAIWVRVYVVYRYNSDPSTRPSGIVKIQGLTT